MEPVKRILYVVCLASVLIGQGCSGPDFRDGGAPEEEVSGVSDYEAEKLFVDFDLEMLAELGMAVRWRRELPRDDRSARLRRFDVVEGRLFAETDHARLYILNIETGNWAAAARLKDVITAAPAIIDGRVYVHTYRDWTVIGAATGVVHRRLPARLPLNIPPVPYDGALMLGSATGAVVRFDPADGAFSWIRSVPGGVLEPVVARDHRVIAAGERGLIAVDATTGALHGEWRPAQRVFISSGPAVSGEHIYVGTRCGFLYCLSLADAGGGVEIKWRFPIGAAITPAPVEMGDKLLIPSYGGGLACIETLPEPRQLWSHPDASVYLAEADSGLYFLAAGHELVLIDPDTGEEKWRIPLQPGTFVAADHGSRSILIGSPEGLIIAISGSE